MKIETRGMRASGCQRLQTLDAALVTVGGLYLDLHVEPEGQGNGNKRDARFSHRLGGSAANCARFGPANGIATAVIAVQQAGWASGYCRAAAAEYGFRLLLQERGDGPAISLVTPNGQVGHKDIYTQRMGPPVAPELTSEMGDALGTARAVIVGPMLSTDGSRDLLRQIPTLAPQAFRALIPHHSLIRDPAFPLIARRYHYTQMNAGESWLLDGATNDLAVNARRLSFLMGEENACGITNGSEQGCLWTGSHWLPIQPKRVQAVDDTGCGDAFAAALVIGWQFLGLSVDDALLYATDAAAVTATQTGIGEPLAYRM
jgi:sugar/nucleoside kinase (ribokinase family)